MPIQRTSSIPVTVQNAITVASRRTGASFDYLVNTAQRESSFKTNAKSASSSAAGLFQFVEGTWLKVVKEDGVRLGLSDLAKNIRRSSSGKYYVPNRGKRREILNMRHDAETSALVAAAYTEHNQRYVRGRIGRTPSDGELYLAHFLGPGSAAKMINLAERQPDSPASRHFPRAARSNKSIFYSGGKSRSLSEVYNILIKSHTGSSSAGLRQTQYGAFDLGIMGSLNEDFGGSHSGTGAAGSIGVWGDTHTVRDTPSRTRSSVDKKTAGTQASDTQRHRHANESYRTAAKAPTQSTPGQSAASNANWQKDAFGGS
ncbi:MAG: hypothetical protein GY927_05865 [bacterium]|nr:hypothetical protein [bacterium]